MHTFESKTLRVHVNSDGSGEATLQFDEKHGGMGCTEDDPISAYVPAEELVEFARWLLSRADSQGEPEKTTLQLQDGRLCEHATWCVTCVGWTNGKPQEIGS